MFTKDIEENCEILKEMSRSIPPGVSVPEVAL